MEENKKEQGGRNQERKDDGENARNQRGQSSEGSESIENKDYRPYFLILMIIAIAIFGFLICYIYNNIEIMKANPLDYLENKLEGDCKCYCYGENGRLIGQYTNNEDELKPKYEYNINSFGFNLSAMNLSG